MQPGPAPQVGLAVAHHGDGVFHTDGQDVVSVEIEGDLDQVTVAGGISATGIGSDAVHTGDSGPDFTDVTLTSEHGKTLVHTNALFLPLAPKARDGRTRCDSATPEAPHINALICR